MRGAAWSWTSLLFFAALAGCINGSVDDALDVDADGPASDGLATSVQAEGPPVFSPAVDPWGDETTKVLAEGVVESGQCYDFATVGELVFGQYLMLGCAGFEIPEGNLVLPGTKRVHIVADASGADVQGEWLVYFGTNVRDHWMKWNGPCRTEKVYTMDVDLSPDEWDPPTAKRTHVFAGDWGCSGGVRGPVKFRITADRDPNWMPLPTLDAWRMPEMHKMLGPGGMNLLDMNTTWKQPTENNLEGGEWGDNIRFPDLVPAGTKQVTVALKWGSIKGCPPTYACGVYAGTISWNQWNSEWAERQISPDGGWVLYAYNVPDEITEDSPYSATSWNYVWPFFVHCDATGLSSCLVSRNVGCPQACGPWETSLRIVVDGWKETADLASVKARLGVA